MEEQSEIQIDLRDYLRVVLKRRWTIISTFVIIFLAVAIHDFTATPIYEATARMIIEKENPNITSIQEVMAVDSSGTDYYQTQYKIIESRTIARKVIERLRLDQTEEFSPKDKDSFFAGLKRSVKETLRSWKEAILSLTREDKGLGAETDADSELVSTFIKRVSVRPIRNSRLLDIGFEAADPGLATRIVNTLAQSYIDHSLEVRLDAIKNAMNWMNERIEKERDRVNVAERALQNYREKHSIITEFSGDVETVTAQKLAKLNEEVVRAESARVEAETKYSQASRLKDNPLISASIPEVMRNPLIQEIKKNEVELFGRISELSKKYGKQHPSMKAAESELESLEKRRAAEVLRVIESLKNEYEVSAAREKSVKAALEKQKHEALELNKKAIEYGVLKRDAESSREMYEILIKRFKETSVTEDLNSSNIRVVDRAEVPKQKSKPRIRRDLLLAMVVGLMLGIGLAFFFEYLDNTLKTPEEIEQFLKVPFLGLIPAFELEGQHGETGAGVVPELITTQLTKSTASEAYRSVRTKILFSSAEAAPKVIMVTSTTAKEGKTITSANLAVTMAQAGSRVLLIDCDMRRPRVHTLLGISRDQGVSNVLVGNSEIKDVILPTGIPNLDVIPCGPIPPNPSELLGSQKMLGLINGLRQDYDRVVIDTPPITAVTDASILSRVVDGVVIIVRANTTAREVVKNAIANLASVQAHVLGVVLNSVEMDKNAYYYQYYYHYGYYAEDGEDLDRKAARTKRKKKTVKSENTDMA